MFEKLSALNFQFPRVSTLIAKFVFERESMKNIGTQCSTNTLKSFKLSVDCCKMKHPYGYDICGISVDRQFKFGASTKTDDLSCFIKEEISLVGEVLRQASFIRM